jgi:hypothetical protein
MADKKLPPRNESTPGRKVSADRLAMCVRITESIRYRLVTDHEKLGASDSSKTLPVYETPDGATIAGDSVIQKPVNG